MFAALRHARSYASSYACIVLALAAGVPTFAIADEVAGPASKYITERITVAGAVEHPLVLDVAALRAFAPPQLAEVALARKAGAGDGKPDQLKGVLLRAILEKAGVVTRDHNDVKKMAVIAIASDGYKVVYSWSEIFNSAAGDGMLVYFEKNGQPLADDEGRIAMIAAKDIRTGPRHVRWLQSIEVKKIAE